jgi:N6-adenosine-specific RNA methylase IME4
VKYRVLIADPPWNYHNAGCRGAAENHYPTMTVHQICDLPIADLVDPDAALFLWATWPQLREGLDVIRAWGFDYVTGLPWLKIVGPPSIDLWGDLVIKAQYGVGFWIRGCTEPLLIAKRGKTAPASGDLIGLLSENLRHSRKPENIYHIAERLPGPYLELFARRPRVGWDAWGDQIGSTVAALGICPAAETEPAITPVISESHQPNLFSRLPL